ncbi:MAG: NAD(P)/FAD-dependent oxidoreductase [Candidatus Magasanikbacteria bacterium]|nr:NAD(P)/FAD-dependent oxidoreductase [Candidatus Magasanikbacteria bacterium]
MSPPASSPVNRLANSADIIILGAGIGGWTAFRTLARGLRRAGLPHTIILINDTDYFTFKPLLHEVVSGSVLPEHASFSLPPKCPPPHVFVQARVQKINPPEKTVATDRGLFSYQYCIVALGSNVNYFNIPGAAAYSYPITDLPAALRLRQALMDKIAAATTHLNVVIVGGGYTGVEVAGQLAWLARQELSRRYPQKQTTITIVERGAQIAATLPLPAQSLVKQRLEDLGVRLLLGAAVQKVTNQAVRLADGTMLPADVTVWAAGLRHTAPDYLAPESLEKNCLPVNEHLQLVGFPTLYAIGDIAYFCPPSAASPAPQLGETAHKEGEYAARHIIAALRRRKIKPFRFVSKGTVMPIGEHYGLLIIKNRMVLKGLLAWWFRRLVYVWYLPGPAHKLKLMLDWSLPPFNIVDIIRLRKK